MAQSGSNVDLRAAVLQARNDIGGYFLDRYSNANGRFDAVNGISAIGAVSGAFAHRQALSMLSNGTMPPDRTSYINVQAADGRTYWLGDAINYVIFEARGPDLSLYSLVAAAAGVPDPEASIDFAEIFRNTASTIGGPAFAAPRAGVVPRPSENPMNALTAHVPVLRTRMQQLGVHDSELVVAFGAAAQGLVPICAGERPNIPVAQSVSRVQAVQLFFEAAIPISKLDPSLTGVR